MKRFFWISKVMIIFGNFAAGKREKEKVLRKPLEGERSRKLQLKEQGLQRGRVQRQVLEQCRFADSGISQDHRER